VGGGLRPLFQCRIGLRRGDALPPSSADGKFDGVQTRRLSKLRRDDAFDQTKFRNRKISKDSSANRILQCD
jgi:hypothetical protein